MRSFSPRRFVQGHQASTAPNVAVLFTTYHPLLVESVLLCPLILGDFAAVLRAFVRAATVVDGLEGYLIFLPPRSMAQVEFVETLERLAGCWRVSVQPHSRARTRHGNGNAHNGKLAIEAPHVCTPSPLAPSPPPSPTPIGATHHPDSANEIIVRPTFAIDVFLCFTLQFHTHTLACATYPVARRDAFAIPCARPAWQCQDLIEALDCARIILASVAERHRGRTEQNALEK